MQAVVAETTPGSGGSGRARHGHLVATELLARDLQRDCRSTCSAAVISNGSVILHSASLQQAQKLLRGPLGPYWCPCVSNRLGFIRGFGRVVRRRVIRCPSRRGNTQSALWSHNGGLWSLHTC